MGTVRWSRVRRAGLWRCVSWLSGGPIVACCGGGVGASSEGNILESFEHISMLMSCMT